MKNLTNLKNKITAKAVTAVFRAKETLKNNAGMEVLQVLIIVIISLVLGALLLTTMKTQFGIQLATVGIKMTEMFN